MSVDGYLEDLGICEILQILSLSKKTGTLHLESGSRQGCVTFQRGQIIRAVSSEFPQELGQVLKNCRLITEQQLQEALRCQQQLEAHRPLGELIVDLFGIPAATIEQAVAGQIEKVILSFVAWREGRFSFAIEKTSAYGTAQLNPLDLMLEKGLSPRRLALKGQKAISRTSCDDATLDRELAEIDAQHSHKGLDLLRGMLAELEHPEFGGGVILLILRYASEIMNRAVIFDLRGEFVVGVGQFGVQKRGAQSPDDIVRQMKLRVEGGSVFGDVLKNKRPYLGKLGDTAAERDLTAILGGCSSTVFLGPLLSEGRVVAMLYGELSDPGVASAKLDAFKVFLAQAGLAIEQALQGG